MQAIDEEYPTDGDGVTISSGAGDNLNVEIIGRRVFCQRDMLRWERSEALADIVAFVDRMNVVAKRYRPAAKGRNNARTKTTRNVDRVLDVLRCVAGWAEQHDSYKNDFAAGTHFGKFHDLLHVEGYSMLTSGVFGQRRGDHRVVELPVYLENSFGDPTNMTYGLEHELSFCMFLIALFKLHHLTCADESFVVPVLFARYLELVECLISAFGLEPSTKYGHWAVDDFRFIAFLWGSAQLAAGNEERDAVVLSWPAAAVADVDAARRHRAGYVFMRCMDAVHDRRRRRCHDGRAGAPVAPLWWHSYQLWNLATAAPNWHWINERLAAAFRRDVLDRFSVVRRLMFGELLKFTRNPRPPGVLFHDGMPAEPEPAAPGDSDHGHKSESCVE